MSKATIEDVARVAGVSISTVSRVLNNNYPVKEETRKKVEDAIVTLEFTPNSLARGLIRNKTFTVGVITPSITNLFFPVVVGGIQEYFQGEGYTILLSDTGGAPEQELKHCQNFKERRVDGVISIDPRTANIKSGFYEKLSGEIQTVLINGYSDGVACNFVINDQATGARQALQYLVDLGHKSIVFVRGDDSYSYDLKEEVFYRVLRENNLPAGPGSIVRIGSGNSVQTMEMSIAAVKERLEAGTRPTAVFACNDWMAIGALYAAQALGLALPEDLSVIGYDNILVSQLSRPRLTTVDQNMHRLGRVSAELLLGLMQRRVEPFQRIHLDTKLVVRESAAPYGT